ncbi:MAG: hypothetical protein WDN44_14225 [Sphingomonas sp.]
MTAAVGTALESAQQTTAYGNLDLVSSVVDANGNRTSYQYDGFLRLVKTLYPDTALGSGTSSSTDYE